MPITHIKTADIADWTQEILDAQIALGNYPIGTVLADIVLPSDWNAGHTVNVDLATEVSGQLPAGNMANAILMVQVFS